MSLLKISLRKRSKRGHFAAESNETGECFVIRSSGRSVLRLPLRRAITPFCAPNSQGSASHSAPGSEIGGRDFAMSRAASSRDRFSLISAQLNSCLASSLSEIRAAVRRRYRAALIAILYTSSVRSSAQRQQHLFQMSQRPWRWSYRSTSPNCSAINSAFPVSVLGYGTNLPLPLMT